MMLFFLALLSQANAQITDASFFPSVRSINPGVVHLRRGGLASYDYGKKMSEKKHAVKVGGIVDPITTDIELTKKTLFAAAASRFISGEILFDQESGERTQIVKHPTWGNRTTSDEAESTYYGGMLDFRFFGVSLSQAQYDFVNRFRVGTPPDFNGRDEGRDLHFTNFKIGTALKIGFMRVAGYVMNQKSSGDYSYTYYDPTTGNKGTTETYNGAQSVKGYGVGLGMTLPRFRSEVSLESMYDNDFSLSEDYPGEITEPKDSSRLSFVMEANLRYFSVGGRFRSIKGNYVDLEDIISTNMLYDSLGEGDTRNEMTFNFSLGDSKGFSPSAFYTSSEVTSQEKSPVLDNGLKYKAVTKSTAYGIALSYRF